MSKLASAAVLIWLFISPALAGSLEDAPLPAAISLVRENGSLNFRDDNGQSLYTFDRDTSGHSACDGSCTTTWPPVAAPDGAHPIGDWTPVRRADNSLQWAYKDRPVYTYRGDVEPGQTNGDGAGGVWRLLRP